MGRVKLKLTLTDKQVVKMLRQHRWPDGVRCIYYGSSRVVKNGRAPNKPNVQRYLCKAYGKQFSDITKSFSPGRVVAKRGAYDSVPLLQAWDEPAGSS